VWPKSVLSIHGKAIHDRRMDMVGNGRTRARARSTILSAWVTTAVAACSADTVTPVDDGSSTGTTTAATEEPPAETTAAPTDATDSTGPAPDDTTGPVAGCGNGLVDPGEQCDGEDHDGSTCMSLFGYDGELSCADACTFELLGCVPPGMILIPGGSFEMGSDAFSDDERPARQVEVDPFYIDATEVTVEQYALCYQTGSCEVPNAGGDCNWEVPGREGHPVNCVSWFDAYVYCGWIGGTLEKRLPTEAEWEKAARGEDARIYPWGDDPPPSCTHASMNEGAGGGCGVDSSIPVGSKPLGDSPYAVHDMAGSVWDWVADWYAVYDFSETDNPTGPASGRFHVIRGGGWNTTDLNWFRTSARNPTDGTGNANIGFRCAQPLPTLDPG
jgi:formylglycine-generating enzyme required for sulfatase activity